MTRAVAKFIISAVLGAAFLQTSCAAKVPVPKNACYLSAYFEEGQKTFEAQIGKKIAVGMFYVDWRLPNFPRAVCDNFIKQGTIPHLSWEPFGSANSNQKILDGSRDAYIRRWARQIKAWGKPLFIRWGLEMNGDWYSWSGARSGGERLDGFGDPAKPDGPERFVAAYRRIHDIFRAQGVTNVSWVFAPNNISLPDTGWNRIENYYPGKRYVDWLAIDGYNFGNTNDGTWQTFDEVFAASYATMKRLGRQPVMLAEFASAEIGGDKAAWIRDAFGNLRRKYPSIKAVTWFDINKETDWRVSSSPAALQAFREAVANPYFLGKARRAR